MLTAREIANQEKATFDQEQHGPRRRASRWRRPRARPTCRRSSPQSQVGDRDQAQRGRGAEGGGRGRGRVHETTGEADAHVIKVKGDADAHVVKVKGEAEAHVLKAKGEAEATAIEAQGVARAIGFEKQREALGSEATALVALFSEIGDGNVKIVPDVLVGSGSSIDGLAAMLTRQLAGNGVPFAPGNRDGDDRAVDRKAATAPGESAGPSG